ncbi:MAG: diguanylate cyclase domain-containing protein [Armatimonadota bacterium]
MANPLSKLTQRLTNSPAMPFPAGARPGVPAHVEDPAQAEQALALSRELLHAAEQFVIPATDLDSSRFLNRLRATAAGIHQKAEAPTLQLFQQWAQGALAAFGALQRRYIREREDELWRLADIHAQAAARGHHQDAEFLQALRDSHGRMRQIAGRGEGQEVLTALQEELQSTRQLVDRKAREDKERVQALARQVAGLEAALAQVRGQARLDSLTGLHHRGALQERAEQLLTESKPFSLALLDLDDFKTINDSLGHLVGDRLLCQTADLLRRVARSNDLVARLGGDEFCVLSPGMTPDYLAQRLAGAVGRRHVHLQMEDRAVSALLSVSVGIAHSEPDDSFDTLLHRADQPLLAVKRGGKNSIALAPRA